MPRLKLEVMVLLLLVGALMGKTLAGSGYASFDTLVDVHHELTRYFVDQPDEKAMLEGAIDGMVSRLNDPYTDYFSPDELKAFDEQTRATFSGIGAEIDEQGGHVVITTPLEDSPAFKAGILAGDIILAIDGKSAEGFTREQAVDLIRGPEGTQVKLKVRHTTNEEVELVITRARIEVQTVKGFRRDANQKWDYLLDHTAGVAYVRMSQFSEPTAHELSQAVKGAQAAGMKGLILDMRFNPGGLLEQATQISDMFLSKGMIVSSAGRNSPKQVWEAKPDNDLGDFPMVVLVNEASASASEIVAGALKDNERAVIVGTRSYGKGSVQQVRGLPDGAGAVKVTTALYYLPSGRNIHKREGADTWGVDPNEGYYVPMSFDQIVQMNRIRNESDVLKKDNGGAAAALTPQDIEKKLSDPQLAAAYKAMLGRLQTGKFEPTGQTNATLLAHLSEKANLEKTHEALSERLAEVDKRLEEINKKLNGHAKEETKEQPK